MVLYARRVREPLATDGVTGSVPLFKGFAPNSKVSEAVCTLTPLVTTISQIKLQEKSEIGERVLRKIRRGQ